MGKVSAISWTRSTFNPWIGCTKVGPGCDHCYAEALDARHRYGNATHWGNGVPRHRTTASYWAKPLHWNKIAAMEKENGSCVSGSGKRGKHASGIPAEVWHAPGFWPVFPSLCDPFDNEVPREWLIDFIGLIRATPHLTWLLLTKRIGNAEKMMPEIAIFQNVWLGGSIVNQEEADRDIPKLLVVPAAKRFVSYEPALGPVDWRQIPVPGTHGDMCDLREIDQIIVGGESNQGGAKARPFNVEWAYSTLRQCRAAGVACFIKQLGSNCAYAGDRHPWFQGRYDQAAVADYDGVRQLKDRAGADPSEWPYDLRVQEFPITKDRP